jgi:hypothetical protein
LPRGGNKILNVNKFNTMWKVNKKGRSYPLGKALLLERRVNIVDEIRSKGGD